jgi:hypothetical protein
MRCHTLPFLESEINGEVTATQRSPVLLAIHYVPYVGCAVELFSYCLRCLFNILKASLDVTI